MTNNVSSGLHINSSSFFFLPPNVFTLFTITYAEIRCLQFPNEISTVAELRIISFFLPFFFSFFFFFFSTIFFFLHADLIQPTITTTTRETGLQWDLHCPSYAV